MRNGSTALWCLWGDLEAEQKAKMAVEKKRREQACMHSTALRSSVPARQAERGNRAWPKHGLVVGYVV